MLRVKMLAMVLRLYGKYRKWNKLTRGAFGGENCFCVKSLK